MAKQPERNMIVKTVDIHGVERIYQLPNDINHLIHKEWLEDPTIVKTTLKNALITVPKTRYVKGVAKMTMVKVTNVFTFDRTVRWRTRGQFLTYDNWATNLWTTTKNIRFVQHDYTPLNKLRLTMMLLRWHLKEKLKRK